MSAAHQAPARAAAGAVMAGGNAAPGREREQELARMRGDAADACAAAPAGAGAEAQGARVGDYGPRVAETAGANLMASILRAQVWGEPN